MAKIFPQEKKKKVFFLKIKHEDPKKKEKSTETN